MSDIRRRLRSPPLTLREAISQHEMIIDSMGALPDAEASHPRGIRPFPLPLSPAVFVSPRAGSSSGPALLHDPRIPLNSAPRCNLRHTPSEKSVV
jgi:hypothetical protein